MNYRKCTFPIMMAMALLTAGPIFAQSADKSGSEDRAKKSTIRVQVTEDNNGKTRNIEKNYEVGPMSAEEKDRFVEKVLDSLGVNKDKKQTISITIDDGDGDLMIAKKRKRAVIDHHDEREPLAYHWKSDHDIDFEWDSEKFHNNMKELENVIRPKAKLFMKDMESFGNQMGDIWTKEFSKPASVRSLNVYSNNPYNGILNLRFSVPEKGDVTVTVTDTKGKEVGKKEIKDFEGEFVGQIELKKNTKGTLFVTVVQNEDGTVKRVVIP